MNANEVALLAKSTLNGSMPFAEIVGKLINSGVEYYHVDFASGSFTYYSASGAAVIAPITMENPPLIAEDFDVTALKAEILDSRQHAQARLSLVCSSGRFQVRYRDPSIHLWCYSLRHRMACWTDRHLVWSLPQ